MLRRVRIISGSARGRRLKAPKGLDVRPTSDKVRGAVFNILAAWPDPRVAFEGARVLDLVAGTGAVALEALSRGAASAVFVDASAQALDAVRENLALTGFTERARVVRRDLERGSTAELGAFDLVFVDPPYDLVASSRAVQGLAANIAPGGIAMVEHDADTPSPPIAGLEPVDRREYGSTGITFYRRAEDVAAGQPEDDAT